MSSKMAVEYMQIKLCPVKLLNNEIAMHTHVAFLLTGSIKACQMLSLSYFGSEYSLSPAISSSNSFSCVY